MPIKIPDGLPAIDILAKERIDVMDETTAVRQDIRPLRILLFNLMPDKITTETQIARVLGASPLQIELTLMRTASYMGKNTSEDHLLGFYETFDTVKDQKFDGILVTGAPVETMDFEDVQYCNELTTIMNWANTNCYSQFYICWGAQAALNHFYGVEKYEAESKLFGVYPHERLEFYHPLVRGFDDVVSIPVSRHTEIDETQIEKNDSLTLLLKSSETGTALMIDDKTRRVFMLNHFEYDRETLKDEYDRDIAQGNDIDIPAYYFPNDDDTQKPIMNWRAHRNLLFTNWINTVYQGTPYDLSYLK
jgi:homoserine O-succinyltransferase